ncbi:hypothetical protein [Streptomyces sp. NPDC005438]|uniref:hypothetical protein n=1 Tax=Streptomyces sp. NPDC005438 TaxID=3156880 RepID=UPI00339E6BB5
MTCDESVAKRVEQLVAPYFTLQEGAVDTAEWEVTDRTHGTPPDDAVRESVTAQGEVSVDYAVDHADRRLYHLAPRGEAWVTQSLLRATRAIHRSTASRRGDVFLHAGIVELNGAGVALVGGSRSGKTSLIMASVLNGSGLMVCNDDVSLTADADGAGVTGMGWPRSISVRLDTLDLLLGTDRAEAVRATLSHPANRTLVRLRESGVEPHGTALLYPWEYADVLDTRVGRSADVRAIVHLGLTDAPGEGVLEPVRASERGDLFDRHVLSLPNKHLNIFRHEPAPGGTDRTREALTALPTFRFRYDFRDVRRQAECLAEYLNQRLPRP